jgi:hypothetical protein
MRKFLIMLVILVAWTTNYADASSGIAGAIGTTAAKKVGTASAQRCFRFPPRGNIGEMIICNRD